MQDNQKKDGQQKMAAKRGRTLAGIIVLLILGFLTNNFLGEEGRETGQDSYTTGVTVTGSPTQAISPDGEGDRTEGSTPTQAVSPNGEGDRTEGSTPTQAISPNGEGDRTEGSTPTQAVSPNGEGDRTE
ncbi:MAG: hypothetical protein K2N63_13135, partial [Lachnospiraceae bacterium]|nr:hypothetical protein [Lachnospiraceae bacterium]